MDQAQRTESELISQIDNVRKEQETLNEKLSQIMEVAISKPLEEKVVLIGDMKEIQIKITGWWQFNFCPKI